MRLQPVGWRELSTRHDRACARLAAIARTDTIHGGARAMVLARRLARMGSSVPASEIVSEVYGASTGHPSRLWSAWECPECGQAWLGQEAAYACCADAGLIEDGHVEDVA